MPMHRRSRFRLIRFAGILTAAAFWLGTSSPALADLEDGVEAFKQHDWERAKRELLPPAQAGNAEAQYRLGMVHEVLYIFDKRRNDGERLYHYFLQAAKQGHPKAQRKLAELYMATGVPEDFDRGVAWALRAVVSGKQEFDAAMMFAAYCYGPDYQIDIDLGAAWYMLFVPDYAFARPPAVLDEEWSRVRVQWDRVKCFDSVVITKEFVRAAHRRAYALSEAYGIPARCLSYPLSCSP